MEKFLPSVPQMREGRFPEKVWSEGGRRGGAAPTQVVRFDALQRHARAQAIRGSYKPAGWPCRLRAADDTLNTSHGCSRLILDRLRRTRTASAWSRLVGLSVGLAATIAGVWRQNAGVLGATPRHTTGGRANAKRRGIAKEAPCLMQWSTALGRVADKRLLLVYLLVSRASPP